MERSVATQSIHLDNNILGRLHIVPPLHVNTLGLDNVFDDAEDRAGRLGLIFVPPPARRLPIAVMLRDCGNQWIFLAASIKTNTNDISNAFSRSSATERASSRPHVSCAPLEPGGSRCWPT